MPTATATRPPVDQVRKDRNDELFTERAAILAEVAELGNPNPLPARLSYRLDDITTIIINENSGLVRGFVRRLSMRATPEQQREYVDAGMFGLMQAIHTYEVGKGTFASWARKRVKCEVLKAVRQNEHPTLSQVDFEIRHKVLAVAYKSVGEHGKIGDADYADVAKRVDGTMTVERVARIIEEGSLVSLSGRPVGKYHKKCGDDQTVEEVIPDETVGVEDDVIRSLEVETLNRVKDRYLTDREKFVIGCRTGEGESSTTHYPAIGRELGISRETVRKIEDHARAVLLHPIVLRQLVRSSDPAPYR